MEGKDLRVSVNNTRCQLHVKFTSAITSYFLGLSWPSFQKQCFTKKETRDKSDKYCEPLAEDLKAGSVGSDQRFSSALCSVTRHWEVKGRQEGKRPLRVASPEAKIHSPLNAETG